MKKLIVLCSFLFVAELSAGKWESRKRKAAGLSNVESEEFRQELNAHNFGKKYKTANDIRMEDAQRRVEVLEAFAFYEASQKQFRMQFNETDKLTTAVEALEINK